MFQDFMLGFFRGPNSFERQNLGKQILTLQLGPSVLRAYLRVRACYALVCLHNAVMVKRFTFFKLCAASKPSVFCAFLYDEKPSLQCLCSDIN